MINTADASVEQRQLMSQRLRELADAVDRGEAIIDMRYTSAERFEERLGHIRTWNDTTWEVKASGTCPGPWSENDECEL